MGQRVTEHGIGREVAPVHSERGAEPTDLREQLAFFSAERVVNVASVPQRSPLRYPGGKTWLVPRIRAWIARLGYRPGLFIEPFAGGGIAALTVIFEDLADYAIMCERDEDVAALWQLVLRDADWLISRILSFEMSADQVDSVLLKEPRSLYERGFATLIRNRVQRGGIMAKGASRMKNGENGKGLASRWYPKTLARRVAEIHRRRDRITFVQGDGFGLIGGYANDPTAVFFVDPPYTAGGKRAGKRLYAYNDIDHNALFALMARVRGSFLMTYDDAEQVRQLATEHGFSVDRVPMTNTHHEKQYELLVTRGTP